MDKPMVLSVRTVREKRRDENALEPCVAGFWNDDFHFKPYFVGGGADCRLDWRNRGRKAPKGSFIRDVHEYQTEYMEINTDDVKKATRLSEQDAKFSMIRYSYDS